MNPSFLPGQRDAVASTERSIHVIIPFFQRESGLLGRAVDSVLAQDVDLGVHIIVVDDQSPVPARDEIASQLETHGDRITLIEQRNGGPGRARNAALDTLPRTAGYVAFLDSDDIWCPGHLGLAVRALEQGFDLYFCDVFHPGSSLSAFAHEEQLKFPNRLIPSEHRPVAGVEGCFAFQGNIVDRMLFVQQDLMPSCVVYKFSRWPDVRFPENYYHSGEDELFFAELGAAGARFVFSDKPMVRRGFGVNVFDSSGWGTVHFLARLSDEIRHRREAFRRFGTSEFHSRKYREQVQAIRTNFTMGVLSRIRRHPKHLVRDMKRYVRSDRAILWSWPYYLLSGVLSRKKSGT